MKTTSKRIMSLLLALAMISTLFVFSSYAEADLSWTDPVTNIIWYYTVDSGKATITFAENANGNVTTPAALGGYPVTAIGSPGFGGAGSITRLTLSEGIATVADGALANLSGKMFNIRELVLPSTLVNIDFAKVTLATCQFVSFTSGTVGNPAFKSIDGVVFSGDGTTLLKFPLWLLRTYTPDKTYTIPEGVTSIAANAFQKINGYTIASDSAEINVKLPESLKRIESRAFYDFEFGDRPLYIPKSVAYIAPDAFGPYSMRKMDAIIVNVENNNYHDIDGLLCNKEGTTLIKCPGEYLTSRGANRTFVVPDSITAIEADALTLNDLEVLDIKSKVSVIGGNWLYAINDFNYLSRSLCWATSAVVKCNRYSQAHTLAKTCGINYVLNDFNINDPADPHGPYWDGDNYFIVQNGAATLLRNKELIYSYGDEAEVKSPLVCANGEYVLAKLNREALYIGVGPFNGHQSPLQAKKLVIPEGVTNIGSGLLAGNYSSVAVIADIYLPSSLTDWDENWIPANYTGTFYLNSNAPIHESWVHPYSYKHVLTDLKMACTNVPNPANAMAKSLGTDEYYSFANSCENFTLNEYYTSFEDFLRLRDHIRGIYKEQSAYPVLNAAQNMRYNGWGGSCYGMSVTSLLNRNYKDNTFVGKLDFLGLYGNSKTSMSQFGVPKNDKPLESAVNYYQIAQTVPFVRSDYYGPRCGGSVSDLHIGVEEAVNLAKEGKRFLMSYRTTDGYGHTLVVHGYEDADWDGYYLLAWDNRYPDRDSRKGEDREDIKIFVSNNYKRLIVDGVEVISGIEIDPFLGGFDRIAINKTPVNTAQEQLNGTTLGITAEGDFSITGENNKTIEFNSKGGEFEGDGEFTGELDADIHFTVNSTADGRPAPATLLFDVAESQAYTFESEETLDVSMLGEGVFAAAKSDAADEITIDPDAGITVQGDGSIDFETSMGVNNGIMDMVTVSGTANDDAKVSLYDEGVLVEAETDHITLKVFSDTVNVQEITVDNEYGNVLVVGDGSGEEGAVAVKASSKNDENFDVDLLHETHAFSGWSVRTPATCTKAGEEERTCLCDEVETRPIAALGHSWGDWSVTKAATEQTSGIETRTCTCSRSDCGQIETKPIDRVPHKHVYTSKITLPSCTVQGFTAHTCACGHNYVDSNTQALNHKWGEWSVTKAATADQEGVETRVCANDAGHTEKRAIPKLTITPQKWWEKLSSWLQFILRWLCFGWIWMR